MANSKLSPSILLAKAGVDGPFKTDGQWEELLAALHDDVPVVGFTGLVTEEMWLKEVLKDLNRPGQARSVALKMLADYFCIGKSKGGRIPSVTIDED